AGGLPHRAKRPAAGARGAGGGVAELSLSGDLADQRADDQMEDLPSPGAAPQPRAGAAARRQEALRQLRQQQEREDAAARRQEMLRQLRQQQEREDAAARPRAGRQAVTDDGAAGAVPAKRAAPGALGEEPRAKRPAAGDRGGAAGGAT